MAGDRVVTAAPSLANMVLAIGSIYGMVGLDAQRAVARRQAPAEGVEDVEPLGDYAYSHLVDALGAV